MTYRFIDSQKANFPIKVLCRVCQIPRSSYYDWIRRRPSIEKRQVNRQELKDEIKLVHGDSKCRYGAPKITAALRIQGLHVSRKVVANLMVELGIRGSCSKKKFKTTRSDKAATPSPDLVNRDFSASCPDEIYVSDLTYIPTKEGWLYLVTIMDVFSRRILGWSIDTNMTTDLLVRALDQLKATRGRMRFAGTKFHSYPFLSLFGYIIMRQLS